MKNFKELRIWQSGFQLALNCFKITESFPSNEKFGLTIQITRAGVSIPSNIAEGNSRSSEKDKKRYIEIALGSSFELETQLLIAKELKYGSQELLTETLALLAREEKMIHTFMKTLTKD